MHQLPVIRGKNTNNTAYELRIIMQDIENGKFDFDGMDAQRVKNEINEDLAQISADIKNRHNSLKF